MACVSVEHFVHWQYWNRQTDIDWMGSNESEWEGENNLSKSILTWLNRAWLASNGPTTLHPIPNFRLPVWLASPPPRFVQLFDYYQENILECGKHLPIEWGKQSGGIKIFQSCMCDCDGRPHTHKYTNIYTKKRLARDVLSRPACVKYSIESFEHKRAHEFIRIGWCLDVWRSVLRMEKKGTNLCLSIRFYQAMQFRPDYQLLRDEIDYRLVHTHTHTHTAAIGSFERLRHLWHLYRLRSFAPTLTAKRLSIQFVYRHFSYRFSVRTLLLLL